MGPSRIHLVQRETTVLTTHPQVPLALPACLQPWAPEPQTKLPAGPNASLFVISSTSVPPGMNGASL